MASGPSSSSESDEAAASGQTHVGTENAGDREVSGPVASSVDAEESSVQRCGLVWAAWEVLLLVVLFYVYAGDPPPAINEAHYWVKAKNFWEPTWLAHDAFVASGKAHTTFYATFGYLTQLFSLPTAVWVGRFISWTALAIGLQRLSWVAAPVRYGSLIVAAVWLAGIEYADLAGEWVVGGIEAKVPAYAFALLALRELVRGAWQRVWPLLGMASAFHVLVGGWSVVAVAFTWLILRKRIQHPTLTGSARLQVCGLLLGGALSLFGLLPALWLSLGSTEQQATWAAKIYTYQRLSHHLLPAALAWQWYFRHGLLVLATAAVLIPIARRRNVAPIAGFTVGVLGLVVIGLLLGLLPSVAPALAAKLLRFYWFRMTDAMVPLALGLGLVAWLWERPSRLSPLVSRATLTVVVLIAVGLLSRSIGQRLDTVVPPACDLRLLGGSQEMPEAQRREIFHDWTKACAWVRDNTPEDAIFLTPRHQQTFKWYAHRAEVVNWKDVPQDAASLLDWRVRFERVFPRRLGRVRVTIQYKLLSELRRDYGPSYMLVDQRIVSQQLPLRKVYPTRWDPNATYAIYMLPPP